MKLVVLTHYITSYRISTFVALGRKVDLTLLLSSSLSDPKLNETGLNIRILPSLLVWSQLSRVIKSGVCRSMG